VHFFIWLANQRLGEKQTGKHRYLDWEFRVGERIQILIPQEDTQSRIVLPIEALIRRGGKNYIFRLYQDRCEQIEVQLVHLDENQAVLPRKGPLSPGDEVVIKGALQVQLAMESQKKPQANVGGHGHAH